jgi:hypothetical protein
MDVQSLIIKIKEEPEVYDLLKKAAQRRPIWKEREAYARGVGRLKPESFRGTLAKPRFSPGKYVRAIGRKSKQVLGSKSLRNPKVMGAGVLLAGMLGASKLDTFLSSRERQRGFKAMMESSSELQKSKNKMQVLQLYNALWELNPTIAKNPLTAGTFVKGQIEMGDQGMHLQTVSALLKARQPEQLKGEFARKTPDLTATLLEGIAGGL